MNEFMLIAGMTVVTYAIRYPIIVLLGRVAISQSFFQSLQFVPPAVLTAIIVPALFLSQGRLDVSLSNTRLLAGLLAILIAWRTKHLLLTIVVGMIGFWLLQKV